MYNAIKITCLRRSLQWQRGTGWMPTAQRQCEFVVFRWHIEHWVRDIWVIQYGRQLRRDVVGSWYFNDVLSIEYVVFWGCVKFEIFGLPIIGWMLTAPRQCEFVIFRWRIEHWVCDVWMNRCKIIETIWVRYISMTHWALISHHCRLQIGWHIILSWILKTIHFSIRRTRILMESIIVPDTHCK